MHVLRIWHLLSVLGFMGASLCMDEVEYEGDYEDDYDNEISQEQQGGEPPTTPCQAADLTTPCQAEDLTPPCQAADLTTPCQAADLTPPFQAADLTLPCQVAEFSRWDKLLITLENSHMRQNMLLGNFEECCGEMVTLRAQVDKLTEGICQQCLPILESVCRAQVEQARVRLQQGLVGLREEEAEREERLNATLQQLLHSSHEGNALLKQLVDGRCKRAVPSEAADDMMVHQPTQRPGGLGTAFGLGMKAFPSDLKEQEVTSPQDMAAMERALVAMATELQKLQLQLSRVIEQADQLRKDRGDT